MSLNVVMYHYVRDLPRTRFPRIKGLLSSAFAAQVAQLSSRYEMATLDSALAYLNGEYEPGRELCLLTFDDGLKDHLTDVLPVLTKHKVQGLFFLISECLQDRRVVSVHKNHFLMAALDFSEYRRAFLAELARLSPETSTEVDKSKVSETYRWDTPEVAAFKFLLNFCIAEPLRDQILDALFLKYFGSEQEFASELYLSWEEARTMQHAGMIMGGHSHSHTALATLGDARQVQDLTTCAELLRAHLKPQQHWPFSYPYGKKHTYNNHTVETLRKLQFACSFVTDVGPNEPGQDVFRIRRIDTKDVE